LSTGTKQAVAISEPGVQRALGCARTFGYGEHRHLVEPDFDEDFERGVEDLGSTLIALVVRDAPASARSGGGVAIGHGTVRCARLAS